MHLSLPERLEAYAQQQVASGIYSSTSEFVRELIRRHMEQEETSRRAAFYEAIRAGDASLLRGEGKPYHSDFLHELAEQARKNVEEGDSTDSPDALP